MVIWHGNFSIFYLDLFKSLQFGILFLSLVVDGEYKLPPTTDSGAERTNPFFMWLVQYWIEANGILLPIIDLKCSFNGYGLSISSILLPAFSLSSSPIIAIANSLCQWENLTLEISGRTKHFVIALFYFKEVTLKWWNTI